LGTALILQQHYKTVTYYKAPDTFLEIYTDISLWGNAKDHYPQSVLQIEWYIIHSIFCKYLHWAQSLL